MASKILLVLISTLLFLLQFPFSASQNVVKGAYWYSGTDFPVSNIESSLFTHLFVAFADLDPQTNQVTIPSSNQASFSTFTQTVQQKNPSIKTLLSIGGGSESKAVTFASIASNANSRKQFIDSSIKLARSNGFHGLDLDWEYPSNPSQMANFGTLLNEWRAAVSTEAKSTGNTSLLLSAAVFYSSNYYSVNYPIQAISNSLDWINVMAYDFYGPGWSAVTGPPAALYNPGNQVSGDSGIRAWIQAGLPAKKIVLGFPFYGRAWLLANANNHGLFAPTSGSAISGDGSVGYKQIRELITQNKATKVFNATVVTDYCYYGTTWIGYDDTQSISTKVSYAKGKGLLGYFAWQLAGDDNWALSRAASGAWGA